MFILRCCIRIPCRRRIVSRICWSLDSVLLSSLSSLKYSEQQEPHNAKCDKDQSPYYTTNYAAKVEEVGAEVGSEGDEVFDGTAEELEADDC
jgi:hypothetical protein